MVKTFILLASLCGILGFVFSHLGTILFISGIVKKVRKKGSDKSKRKKRVILVLLILIPVVIITFVTFISTYTGAVYCALFLLDGKGEDEPEFNFEWGCPCGCIYDESKAGSPGGNNGTTGRESGTSNTKVTYDAKSGDYDKQVLSLCQAFSDAYDQYEWLGIVMSYTETGGAVSRKNNGLYKNYKDIYSQVVDNDKISGLLSGGYQGPYQMSTDMNNKVHLSAFESDNAQTKYKNVIKAANGDINKYPGDKSKMWKDIYYLPTAAGILYNRAKAFNGNIDGRGGLEDGLKKLYGKKWTDKKDGFSADKKRMLRAISFIASWGQQGQTLTVLLKGQATQDQKNLAELYSCLADAFLNQKVYDKIIKHGHSGYPSVNDATGYKDYTDFLSIIFWDKDINTAQKQAYEWAKGSGMNYGSASIAGTQAFMVGYTVNTLCGGAIDYVNMAKRAGNNITAPIGKTGDATSTTITASVDNGSLIDNTVVVENMREELNKQTLTERISSSLLGISVADIGEDREVFAAAKKVNWGKVPRSDGSKWTENVFYYTAAAAYICDQYLDFHAAGTMMQTCGEGGSIEKVPHGEWNVDITGPRTWTAHNSKNTKILKNAISGIFGIKGYNVATNLGVVRNDGELYEAYKDVTEAVVSRCMFLSKDADNDGRAYKTKVRSKYSKGAEEQLIGIENTDYCGQAGKYKQIYGWITGKSYKSMQYINPDVHGHEEALKRLAQFIKDNKLESECNKAMSYIEAYAKEYRDRYKKDFAGVNKKANMGEELVDISKIDKSILVNNANGSGGGSSSSSSSSSSGDKGSGGVDNGWLCDCDRPCPYCECHNDEDGSSGNSSGNSNNSTGSKVGGKIKSEQGVFQAYWTDKNNNNISNEKMWKYAKKADDKYCSTSPNTSIMGQGFKKWVGVRAGRGAFHYSKDKYKKLFNSDTGYIIYRQSGVDGEEFNYYQPEPADYNTIGGSFCGGFATAIVMSTMLHKYITPIEINIGMRTYWLRHNSGNGSMASFFSAGSGESAIIGEGIAKIFAEQRYEGKPLFKVQTYHSLTEARGAINKAVDNKGMALYVSDAGLFTGGGHWVTIGERSGDKYYVRHSTEKDQDVAENGADWDTLVKYDRSKYNLAIVVTPGEGYNNYIKTGMKVESKKGKSKVTASSKTSKVSVTANTHRYDKEIQQICKVLSKMDSNKVTADGKRRSIVINGLKCVGNPYVWGGVSLTHGCDCSGFVMKLYAKYGIVLPHSSQSQSTMGKSIGIQQSKLKPGDLIFYSPGDIHHVAMYAGGGYIVHASCAKDGIKISRWNYSRVAVVRRFFN